MLTSKNYFKEVQKLDPDNFPGNLRELYEFTREATEDHTSWAYYESSAEVKKAVDKYLDELNQYLKSNTKHEPRVPEQSEIPAPKKKTKSQPSPAPRKRKTTVKSKIKTPETASQPEKGQQKGEPVARISEEVNLIRRYANMQGKVKTPEQLVSLLTKIQKPIAEKRIRETSPYASEVMYMQNRLINALKTVREPFLVQIDEKMLERFNDIAASEKQMLSVTYLKRYFGIHGRTIDKQKAERLQALIEKALEKQKIGKTDPNYIQINRVLKGLSSFTESAGKDDRLEIYPAILNGITNTLNGLPFDLASQPGK